jgi:CHAD domain-containing protein
MNDKPGLRPQDAVGHTLRAIARHILSEARTSIEDRQRVEAVAVHDFRAAMKSWRAYLRLIEPFLDTDDRRWRTEARDLARLLAGARDAQAALDAVADAERHSASHRLSSQSWESIRSRLEEVRASAETASLTPSLRKRILAALDRADARVERWPLDTIAFSDVAENLTAGYRRARHLIPEDWRAASAHDLHKLRQTVVVHRYQMEILEPLWPRLGRSWVREAQKLRARLGSYQDLVVLARLAAPHQPLARWRARLQSVIHQRQAQQVIASRRIAARLFAERPKAFRRRLEAMWDGVAASR